MVTHSATMLEEQHLEAPRPRRRMLAKEDPMSHRIIEKRRRDRMNNCLADLSRLIPADYLKKGRGRIEKTEIIEMAIKHMKYLQAHACRQMESCELVSDNQNPGPAAVEHYRLGYQDCLAEALHFMVEVEGYFAGDPVCIQLINHLQKHCDKILNSDRLNSPRTNLGESSSSCGSSGGYSNNQHTTGSSSGFRSGSSPGSGSGSDGGNNKDVTCGDRQILTSGVEAAVDDQEEVTGGSQLRDMLQEFPVAPPPALQLPADHGSTPSLYKFKNNIKQRFTAEHHTVPSSSASGNYSGVVKRRRFEAVTGDDAGCLNVVLQSKRRDSETCSVPSSPPSPKYNPPRSPSPEVLPRVPPCPTLKASPAPSPGVPIFALHSKGSFYVPLTLDADLLAPYLAPGLDAGNPNVILHPVTISVNFQQTGHVRLQPVHPPWKNELSFPKWSLCAQDRA